MPVPGLPNDRWSLDFVSDQFVCGRRFRILAVFDACTRECLAAVADVSLSGRRVARERDLLIALRGKPKTIVSDNRFSPPRGPRRRAPQWLRALAPWLYPCMRKATAGLSRNGMKAGGNVRGAKIMDEVEKIAI